jgi:hypothetical protein
MDSECSIRVAASDFGGNSCDGGMGGAIALVACVTHMSNSTFAGNRASLSGGALALLHISRNPAFRNVLPALSQPAVVLNPLAASPSPFSAAATTAALPLPSGARRAAGEGLAVAASRGYGLDGGDGVTASSAGWAAAADKGAPVPWQS